MHRSTPKKDGCECRSTTDPDAGAVISLLGPIAILADAPSTCAPAHITKSPNHHITRFTGFIPSPTSPPPRA
jgi:hypothetical protein